MYILSLVTYVPYRPENLALCALVNFLRNNYVFTDLLQLINAYISSPAFWSLHASQGQKSAVMKAYHIILLCNYIILHITVCPRSQYV